ncbi:MAG: hypothetical protein HQM09_22645 [Candidatus Riflebacteria bacterium]|nr:hypothetical protein [Candidatus Riflebacteria bacterium]
MTQETHAHNRRDRMFSLLDPATGTIYSRELFEKDLYRETAHNTTQREIPAQTAHSPAFATIRRPEA